ncbi:PulJ/GspJ family protein [Haloferula sp.]|uniref:PulJ/GspJ family protein n=1 Tax=Haloferula sp. TaxID=2497595 RepID=UPI00329B62D4
MRRKVQGFTLVEILASTAIGSIVLLLAVASLSGTGNEYGRNTDGVAAEREARAVLTQVAEDLSKASGSRLKVEKPNNGWRQDRLGFTCLQPEDAQSKDEAIGDLCLVSYYVKDLQIGKETVRCLMRGFRSSDEVFAAIRNRQEEGLFDPRIEDEPVAFGVIAFEVDPLVRGRGGNWGEWKEPSELDPFAEYPDVIKLKLVVARRELVSKLRSTEDWDESPLIGDPSEAEYSKMLEIYEIIHPFGHAR